MAHHSLHPPSDKIKKAIIEFSELLLTSPEKTRWQLLQLIELKYDLSPQECEFLNKHLREEKK